MRLLKQHISERKTPSYIFLLHLFDKGLIRDHMDYWVNLATLGTHDTQVEVVVPKRK